MKKFEQFVQNARTVTVENNGTTIVIREALGFDVLDAPYMRGALGNALATEKGISNRADLGEVDWGRITEFVDLFPKIISAEGDHALTLPEHPSEDDYLGVYWDWLCWPATLMQAVNQGLKNANKPVADPKAKKSE